MNFMVDIHKPLSFFHNDGRHRNEACNVFTKNLCTSEIHTMDENYNFLLDHKVIALQNLIDLQDLIDKYPRYGFTRLLAKMKNHPTLATLTECKIKSPRSLSRFVVKHGLRYTSKAKTIKLKQDQIDAIDVLIQNNQAASLRQLLRLMKNHPILHPLSDHAPTWLSNTITRYGFNYIKKNLKYDFNQTEVDALTQLVSNNKEKGFGKLLLLMRSNTTLKKWSNISKSVLQRMIYDYGIPYIKKQTNTSKKTMLRIINSSNTTCEKESTVSKNLTQKPKNLDKTSRPRTPSSQAKPTLRRTYTNLSSKIIANLRRLTKSNPKIGTPRLLKLVKTTESLSYLRNISQKTLSRILRRYNMEIKYSLKKNDHITVEENNQRKNDLNKHYPHQERFFSQPLSIAPFCNSDLSVPFPSLCSTGDLEAETVLTAIPCLNQEYS